MIVTFTVTKGDDAGKSFSVASGETKTVGRGSQADLALRDAIISRVHLRIRVEEGACFVLDMGSRNGTSVNGRPITAEVRLADDDVVGLGTTLAEAHFKPDAAAPAPRNSAAPAGAEEPAIAEASSDDIPIEVEVVDESAEQPEAEITLAGDELLLQGEDERLLGTVVGGCRIEGLLGRDDISSIYRATQISMERPVSLKILAPAMTSDQRSVDRFIAAARAGGKLNHPNIVRVYDAGEEKGVYFVAMEFVAGKSVRQMLAERDPRSPMGLPQAVEIAEQIVGALDYAHSLSVVHGHVTADTILVTPHGIAKLAELGFVRNVASGSAPLPANPARRADELQFTPPEYLGAPRSPSAQCDIYSLTVVLFLMVTAQAPFRASTEKALLERIRKGEHEPVRRLRRDVPDVLARAIDMGLAPAPAQRYSRASDLLAALQQARRALS